MLLVNILYFPAPKEPALPASMPLGPQAPQQILGYGHTVLWGKELKSLSAFNIYS